MKTLKVMFVISLLFLAGCSDARGLANVQRELNTNEVAQIPDENYSFIARKADGSVWYVFSVGYNEEVGSTVMILPPSK